MNASCIITTGFQYPKVSHQYGKLLNKAFNALLSSVLGINASSEKFQYLALASLLDGQACPRTIFTFAPKKKEAPKM
jgi:hypothetical protein